MWENNNYTLTFRADPFYRHERIILASGSFTGFLPMTFTRRDKSMKVHYENSGYSPLSRFSIERTEDALYLTEKVLLVLRSCPEHLIDPARVILRTNTVFYSRNDDDLKIAFLPAGSKDTSLHHHLLQFLVQLKRNLRDQDSGLLDHLGRDFYYNCIEPADMLRATGLLRQSKIRDSS